MLRKLYTYNYLWLIIYLWVIGTLPFHQHNHLHEKIALEQGDNQHSSEDECVICLNIHVPFAIDQLPTIDYAAVEIEYYRIYDDDRSIFWYNTNILSPTNRGPPISIIS